MDLTRILPWIRTICEDDKIRELPPDERPGKYGCYYCTNMATQWVWADADTKLRMAVCGKCRQWAEVGAILKKQVRKKYQ